MQVSSNLKCPWCQYLFYTGFSPTAEIGKTVSSTCPKCTGTFTYFRNLNGDYETSNRCELNGVRHNWKYEIVQGYELHKKCRRCGKEDYRLKQLELPGLRETFTLHT